MNQLTTRDLQAHVTILGWLLIVGHLVYLAIGGFLFMLLTGVGVASGEAEAMRVLGVVGTSLGVFLAALAVPGLLAGYGLLTRKTWGRVLAVVVAVLGLIHFPIGTAIGIYALWVLLQTSATEYFEAPAPA